MTSLTVSIWHNVARDDAGRSAAMLSGYRPGDPVVRVFTYQAESRGRTPEAIAEDAFSAFNGHPSSAQAADLSRRYYQRQLRSLSVGDVVTVGEVQLAVARAGWTPADGLTEVRASQYGTRPLPGPAPGDELPARRQAQAS